MKNFNIIGPCIYLEKEKILVVGDIHCGFEEEIRRNFGGIYIGQKKENFKLMEKIIEKEKRMEKIVFLGDITHSFIYKKKEIEELNEFISLIRNKLKKVKIFAVKGNHDLFLTKKNLNNQIKLSNFFIFNENLFIHGEKDFLKIYEKEIKKSKRIFLGHFHPAIEIKENIKTEKFKCFLIGKYRGKEFFFLPSFFPFIEGSDIRKNKEIEYELVKNFRVYVTDEEFNIYDFGKLKKLEKTLPPGIEPGSP